jgi:hypothetical protein
MYLKCKCGHKWDYKGKALSYASCPACNSRVRLNATGYRNPDLERWAEAVPIEINMHQTKSEAIDEAQKYANKVFGEPNLTYWPIVLTSSLRIQHSNYRKLLMEAYCLAKDQGATSVEILKACKIIKDRVDSHIHALMRDNWSETREEI